MLKYSPCFYVKHLLMSHSQTPLEIAKEKGNTSIANAITRYIQMYSVSEEDKQVGKIIETSPFFILIGFSILASLFPLYIAFLYLGILTVL